MTKTDPGLEALTLMAFIWERLSGDAALASAVGVAQPALGARIGEGVVSTDDKTIPWIVFTVMEPRDIKVVGLIQVMAEVQFQVRCSVQANTYDGLIPVYRRVHQLLEGITYQEPSGADGTVLSVGRVSGVQYPETAQGIQYRHLGGLYDTYAQ